MNIGDVVRLHNVRNVHLEGKGWTDFSPGDKEKVFVCILLGTEPKVITKKEDRLDVIKTLNKFGWFRRVKKGAK